MHAVEAAGNRRVASGAAAPFAAAFALVAALLLAASAPASAFAKDYGMGPVSIDAIWSESGNLYVTEYRTFDFDGGFTCVWWDFDSFGQHAQLQVSGVSVSDADGSTVLHEAPFESEWRSEGGPGGYAWSFDEVNDAVYVFFPETSGTMQVSLRYTVMDLCNGYEDVAELYWQFLGPAWAADSCNVSLTVHPPAPDGAQIVPGETVRAWGHGPLSGSVEIAEDGTVTARLRRICGDSHDRACDLV